MNRMTVWALPLALLLTGAAALAVYAQRPYVYAGVSVAGVSVAGHSRGEVYQLVSVRQQDYQGRRLHMYYGDEDFSLPAASLDYRLDVAGTADAAWQYGRSGPWWQRAGEIWTAARYGHDVPLRFSYNEAKLNAWLTRVAARVEAPARNATFNLDSGQIEPHQAGRHVELPELRRTVLAALAQPGVDRVPLTVTPVAPAVTDSDIKASGISKVVASYATTFNPADVNRSANIRLGAQKLSGTILYPGQVISFNDVVGPRDAAHGFKEALEIVNGEFVPGIGGGICQVSSTLYNVVLKAGLKIVERYNHSKPLQYVPLGRDATVVYGVLDFKFVNDTDRPLLLISETSGARLRMALLGAEGPDDEVEIVTAAQRPIPPKLIHKADNNLPAGEVKLEREGQPGYEVTTVRVVRREGREIRREVLGKDMYQADDTVLRVGVGSLPTGAAPRENR